jgi:hypothetical protein
VKAVLDFIRTIFLMRDNPSFRRSFFRYLVFYFLVIPLPAAFMPPVAYAQRKPDFQLLVAVVLLIVINALGDTVSVRVTLHNFEKLKFESTTIEDTSTDNFWAGVQNEIIYYLAVVKGTLYSLGVLAAVLGISSILYAVQIDQLDFELSKTFFAKALERIWQAPGLAFEPYWFRDQPGPFGLPGIPGLFLYGFTTFLPIICLLLLALVWLILLPFRIAVSLPGTRTSRLIASELAVVVICIIAEEALNINVLNVYIFLMHAWTTW